MKVVFIAIPTAGTVKDGKLTEEFLAYFAKLHVENPGVTFISPMTQDYALLPFMPTRAATWEDWGAHCRAIIPRCDEMWVLTFKGWDTSVGVTAEISCALDHNVLVKYVDVERTLSRTKPPKLGTTTSSSAEATKNFQFEKPHT